MKLLKATIVFFSIFFSLWNCSAQDQFQYSGEAEHAFNEALAHYEKGEYSAAAEGFENVLNINPIHQKTTASYLMAAKARMQGNDFQVAVFLLKNFLKRFPESEYTRDAHYTLGSDYYLLGEYENAVAEFLYIVNGEQRDKFFTRSDSLIVSIANLHLSDEEIKELLQSREGGYVASLLQTQLALKGGNKADAIPPETPKIIPKEKKQITIGTLLALMKDAPSNPIKKAAEEIQDGIREAVDEMNNDPAGSFAISLEERDSERDPEIAAKVTASLAKDHDVIGIIGPMFSNQAISAGKVADKAEIPIISPTANETGIGAIGEYVFQANPDVSMHGKALAQYAVRDLGFNTLAVLSPESPAIKSIVENFVSEAKKLGATIVATEWYEKSDNDLSKQFKNIRKAGAKGEAQISFAKRITKEQQKRILAAGVSRKTLDSLMSGKEKIGVNELFGKNGERTANSIGLKVISPKGKADDLGTPIATIDGIFTPVASSEDIGVIASQMTYYNLKTQLLGSAEWFDRSQLETHRRYLDGVIFCSDFYVDENDSTVMALRQRLGSKPTKYTLFGYDVMKFVAGCIEDGATTRVKLQSCLQSPRVWEGLHSSIDFGRSRVNRVMQILQYRDGEVKRIREVIVQ